MGIVKGGAGAASSGKPDYDAGDRVSHIKYGEGTVLSMEPGPRDYKVTVDFDDAGQKIMYAAFAKLKAIKNCKYFQFAVVKIYRKCYIIKKEGNHKAMNDFRKKTAIQRTGKRGICYEYME